MSMCDPAIAMKRRWLLLLLQFLVVRLSRAVCPAADESALLAVAALYKSSSSYFESWGEGECCSWKGVSCGGTSSNVTELSLPGLGLGDVAEQPTPICNLTALRRLDLSYGPLVGPLLPCIANLRQLRYLDLFDNRITSIPPSALAHLSHLHTLLLSYNLINHTISLIFSALPSTLRTLHLNSNAIQGSIPASLFHLHPSLQHLDLSYNSLSGALPTFISPNNSSLQTLLLSGNRLSGAIPPSFAAYMHSLRTLDISQNFLTDALPESMYTLAQLQSINLYGNSLTGSISPSIHKLPALQHIDLSQNRLTGSIPPSIHKLQALQTLDLSDNLLSGAIPPELGSLANLSYLSLSSNNLDPAPFPRFLGNLSKLESLSLSYNSFNSSIPTEWHNFTLLTALRLSGNALSSAPSLPSWLFRNPLVDLDLSSLQLPSASFACDMFRYVNSTIQYLDLSLNNLTSTALLNDCLTRISFPSLAMLNLSHNPLHSSLISSSKLLTPFLSVLDLGSCGLQGSIPDNFVPESISNLYLSNNQLTGELPAGFANFWQATYMDLSHNYFTSSKQPNISGNSFFTLLLSNNEFKGELEYFLANFGERGWVILDVSFNQLTGKIPAYLGNNSSLLRLKMGNNELKGVIPAGLGSLERLITLSLHGNQLVGTIPPTLFNCSSLQVLDLGHNALSGELEDVFFSSTSYNLSALRVLLLGYNQLGGRIPASLGMSSPNLQLLDLSNNHFHGSIPPHLHLPAFIAATQQSPARTTTLATEGTLFEDDISIQAKGSELKYTYILNVLTSFDLSGNSLSGWIPPTMGELTGLMYLNLSRNRLTGSIPSELSKLRALESLDLSFNNLTGSIPWELKDISTLAVFNVSFNEELHGAIPRGAQLTDPNSYLEDTKLCGTPLQACPNVTNSTQAANPHDQKKSAALGWLKGWASIPGIIIGLSVGSIFTLCVLHLKLNGTSMFERLFNLLKG